MRNPDNRQVGMELERRVGFGRAVLAIVATCALVSFALWRPAKAIDS